MCKNHWDVSILGDETEQPIPLNNYRTEQLKTGLKLIASHPIAILVGFVGGVYASYFTTESLKQ